MIPLKTDNYNHMKRACKILDTQTDDYKRDTYDTFENKQL